jgi:hypothetical protein
MKRLFACAGLAGALALSSPLFAQARANSPYTLNHVELGAYGDLFRVAPANSATVNYLGLGGRFGFSVHPHVQLEAEMNYNFEKNFTTTTTTTVGTTTTSTTVTSQLRPLTGLFGPKFQAGTSGPLRAFVTAKAGFVEFSYSNNAPSGSSFANAFNQFNTGGTTHFAAYPGGGLEFFAGPLGLRVEAGDEIWLNNGTAYNNLRVTAGPTLRF